MTIQVPKHMERYRTPHPVTGELGDERNGLFIVKAMGLKMICSVGMGWEHLSVSRSSRVPSYDDLVWCKNQFWDPEDCIMQLMVPASEHINVNNNTLHLWRPLNEKIPRPPWIMV